MKIMLFSSLMFSVIYFLSSNPVLFLLVILIQALMVCLMAWMKLKISWFSFILFLIFLGGLMVIFIYITSLASNEKIILNLSFNKLMTAFLLLILYMYVSSIYNLQQESTEKFIMTKYFNLLYSEGYYILTIFVMLYLLLTLLVVVKIANKFNAPIKNLI